jgi:hypothetical protein
MHTRIQVETETKPAAQFPQDRVLGTGGFVQTREFALTVLDARDRPSLTLARGPVAARRRLKTSAGTHELIPEGRPGARHVCC